MASFGLPWKRPQSTRTRARPVSSRYWEPVTVVAPPRKWRSICVECDSDPAERQPRIYWKRSGRIDTLDAHGRLLVRHDLAPPRADRGRLRRDRRLPPLARMVVDGGGRRGGQPGEPNAGLGGVRRYTFKGSLPYTLSFDLRV